MTFVLVLFTQVYFGEAIATIPGYRTREQCEEAGKEFRSASWSRTDGRYKCIVGPEYAE